MEIEKNKKEISGWSRLAQVLLVILSLPLLYAGVVTVGLFIGAIQEDITAGIIFFLLVLPLISAKVSGPKQAAKVAWFLLMTPVVIIVLSSFFSVGSMYAAFLVVFWALVEGVIFTIFYKRSESSKNMPLV